MPIKFFVSQSRKDTQWLTRLRQHLRPMMATGDLEVWSDMDIAPGEQWRTAIERSLKTADGIVLLLSPDYLASDFISSEELPRTLASAKKRSIPILPIIVHPTVKPNKIDELQVMNPGRTPLAELSHEAQEDVLALTAEKIRQFIVRKHPKKEVPWKSLDVHSQAIENAASATGNVGNVNVVDVGNIFVDAENMLRERKASDEE